MKQTLSLIGVLALGLTSPALAKPGKASGHSATSCAPGLAKKGCMPRGQAKKRFNVGYKFARGYKGWTPYNDIPRELRIRYSLSPGGRYIYDQNYIYRVDPVTLAVSQIITAVLR